MGIRKLPTKCQQKVFCDSFQTKKFHISNMLKSILLVWHNYAVNIELVRFAYPVIECLMTCHSTNKLFK